MLPNIKNSIIRPWAIVGDFNEFLHAYEKIEGTNANSSRMQNFADLIDNCHLLELESFGLPYTWFNKTRDSSSIFEKLDRVLINDQRIYSFRDARVENLPIIGSNRGPIDLHQDKRDRDKSQTLDLRSFGSIF